MNTRGPLTDESTVAELALLLDARGVRLTKLVRGTVDGLPKWFAQIRKGERLTEGEDLAEPHEAINAALRIAESWS